MPLAGGHDLNLKLLKINTLRRILLRRATQLPALRATLLGFPTCAAFNLFNDNYLKSRSATKPKSRKAIETGRSIRGDDLPALECH